MSEPKDKIVYEAIYTNDPDDTWSWIDAIFVPDRIKEALDINSITKVTYDDVIDFRRRFVTADELFEIEESEMDWENF